MSTTQVGNDTSERVGASVLASLCARYLERFREVLKTDEVAIARSWVLAARELQVMIGPRPSAEAVASGALAASNAFNDWLLGQERHGPIPVSRTASGQLVLCGSPAIADDERLSYVGHPLDDSAIATIARAVVDDGDPIVPDDLVMVAACACGLAPVDHQDGTRIWIRRELLRAVINAVGRVRPFKASPRGLGFVSGP